MREREDVSAGPDRKNKIFKFNIYANVLPQNVQYNRQLPLRVPGCVIKMLDLI